MTRYWKVGELASLTGLTIRTLRYYDQIGLYSPSGHTESGHRLYTEADIERLQQILALKELGLSLEEIKSVAGGQAYGLSDIIALQIKRLKENIRHEQKLVLELERVARLMRNNEQLTVEAFTNLIQMMKRSHDKMLLERQASWERHLDLLGEFLSGQPTDSVD